VAQEVFLAEVALALSDVHLGQCASHLSVHSVLYHFGKEVSCLLDFYEPLHGVFLLQHSPCYAQKVQNSASSVLRL
jgi:hypothetical protein